MSRVLTMTWRDLLFAHWPAEAARLRPCVPEGLEIEEHDGTAWIGVVPFHMTGVRIRLFPPVPTASTFPEINVRTYVTDGHRRGVWFFSLDAGSRLAVWAARRCFRLNYHHARMDYEPAERTEDRMVRFRSRRGGPAGGRVEFQGRYRGVGPAFGADEGTLEAFLTERYSLFAAGADGGLWRADIAHDPWPLRRAEAELNRNSMTEPLEVELSGGPHLLYADRVKVWAGRPMRLG